MVDLQLFFAGLWPLLWQWGLGVGLIVLLCAAAWFSPVAKVDFLWAAACVAVFLFAMGYGQRLERERVEAKEKVIVTTVDRAVATTKTPKARATKDPWDNPKN
jgi:hypothetical protein